jgi:hypothetical protein
MDSALASTFSRVIAMGVCEVVHMKAQFERVSSSAVEAISTVWPDVKRGGKEKRSA